MITRLLPLTLLVALVLSGCGGVRLQKFITVPTPESIHVPPVDADSYERRYGKHDGVYLLAERSLRHYGNRGMVRFARTRRVRYVVLDPNAEWLSTASYGFEPGESLVTFYSIVTSPEGVSRLFTDRDLIEERASDGSTRYRLAYPDVRRGTIIEEAMQTDVELEDYPQTTHAAMLQYNIPADTVRFRMDYPAWWTLKVKKTDSVRPPLFKTPPTDKEGIVSISYETREVPALSREPYSPYHKDEGLYFEGTFTNMSVGRNYFSAPGSWNQVGDKVLGRMMPEMPYVYDIEAVTQRVVGDITDPRKKVDAIATWVQDSIKLVGRGEALSENILAERAGDALAITELAISMLDAAKIPARLYFIHSAEDGYFDRDFIDPQQFDIIACGAVVDTIPIIFFPYLRNIPIGFIPGPYRGQSALVLDRDKSRTGGYRTNGIVPLLDDSRSISSTEDSIVATLSEGGDVVIEEHRIVRGGEAIDMRDDLDDMNEEETRKSMQEMIGAAEGDIALESYEVINLKKKNDPLEIIVRYRANNALTVTPEEIVFHTGGLLAPSTESHWKIDSSERRSAIAIYTERHLQKHIRIVYPKEWRLQTDFASQQQTTRYGEVSSSFTRKDGELSVTLRSILQRSRGTRETIGELRQLISAQSTLAVPTLVFSK